jgi:hypothetical protein
VNVRVFHPSRGEANMTETTSWRRGFAAGFAALALGIGGQVATSASDDAEAGESCPFSRNAAADRLAERFTPHVDAHGIAQRVARAVLGLVLQTGL